MTDIATTDGHYCIAGGWIDEPREGCHYCDPERLRSLEDWRPPRE